MQRNAVTILSSLLLITSFASCMQPTVRGKGDTGSEMRNITSAFTSIEISGPVDAEIAVVRGAMHAVKIEGYANLLPYIKTKIEDSTLKIYVGDDVRLRSKKHLLATISLPVLAGVETAGSNDVHISGNVTGEELTLEIAGSGSIKVDALNTTSFSSEIAGAADITVNSGSINSANYDIAGSGKIHAFNLQTVNTDLDVAGSGDAEVAASGKLDVSVSGSGTVQYKGNPAVKKDIAGSGSVEQVQ